MFARQTCVLLGEVSFPEENRSVKKTCQWHRSVKQMRQWRICSVGRVAVPPGALFRKRDNVAKFLDGTSVDRPATPGGSLFQGKQVRGYSFQKE